MSGGHVTAAIGPAGRLDSAVHALDPRAKVIGLLGVTVIAVTAPLEAWPVYVACAAALVAVAYAARVPARTLWRRGRIVLPLIFFVAVFVPFAREGGEALAAAAVAKAAIGTFAAVLLGATTPFPDVLRALEALRVPRVLTLIAAVTWRYLFVLVEDVRRMRTAMSARAYRPRNLLQVAAIGRLATALFLRTHARAERVHAAMLARGFTGSMPAGAPLRLARPDLLFAGSLLALLLFVRVGVQL